MNQADPEIQDDQVEFFRQNGAVLLPGLFRDWVQDIAAGIAHNMREPGPYAAENLSAGDAGRFFDDYCNWRRIPPFERVVRQSSLAAAASQL